MHSRGDVTRDESGRPRRMFGTVQDVTERKRAEEAIHAARDAAEIALRDLKTAQANLVQAEKMASLGQLTAGIAHEIGTPLAVVRVRAERMLERHGFLIAE